MRHRSKTKRNEVGKRRLRFRRTLVIASLCLGLFLFGPHYQSMDSISITPNPVLAQTDDTQGSTGSDEATDDTPSEQDIADFASEYDKDGDGEIDEPEADEEEAEEDEPEQDEADEADDGFDGDDGDESDDQDRDNQYDDDDDGEETEADESEDTAHSGKNRDDIDGEASPEYRLSGYDRYSVEGSLRRLGSSSELTPLIEREERMLLEN